LQEWQKCFCNSLLLSVHEDALCDFKEENNIYANEEEQQKAREVPPGPNITAKASKSGGLTPVD
jgi:hypothetical protein